MRTAVSMNINVPRGDVAFVRKMAQRMGWKIDDGEEERLYDPETGCYVNEETMQAIRDVETGNVKRCKNLDELIATL